MLQPKEWNYGLEGGQSESETGEKSTPTTTPTTTTTSTQTTPPAAPPTTTKTTTNKSSEAMAGSSKNTPATRKCPSKGKTIPTHIAAAAAAAAAGLPLHPPTPPSVQGQPLTSATAGESPALTPADEAEAEAPPFAGGKRKLLPADEELPTFSGRKRVPPQPPDPHRTTYTSGRRMRGKVAPPVTRSHGSNSSSPPPQAPAENSGSSLGFTEERHLAEQRNITKLLLRFPDPELSEDIVCAFSDEIEAVRFLRQPAPRSCHVYLRQDANVAQTIRNLSQIAFGMGFISAELAAPPSPEAVEASGNGGSRSPGDSLGEAPAEENGSGGAATHPSSLETESELKEEPPDDIYITGNSRDAGLGLYFQNDMLGFQQDATDAAKKPLDNKSPNSELSLSFPLELFPNIKEDALCGEERPEDEPPKKLSEDNESTVSVIGDLGFSSAFFQRLKTHERRCAEEAKADLEAASKKTSSEDNESTLSVIGSGEELSNSSEDVRKFKMGAFKPRSDDQAPDEAPNKGSDNESTISVLDDFSLSSDTLDDLKSDELYLEVKTEEEKPRRNFHNRTRRSLSTYWRPLSSSPDPPVRDHDPPDSAPDDHKELDKLYDLMNSTSGSEMDEFF